MTTYPQADHEDLLRDAWGHIADVTGVVTRDAGTGRPLAVRRVTSVDVKATRWASFVPEEQSVGSSPPRA